MAPEHDDTPPHFHTVVCVYHHYIDCWYQHRSISTILTAGMAQRVSYKFHINFQYQMGHTAFSSSNLTLTKGLELSLQQATVKLTSILFGSHPATFGLLTYICTKLLAQSNHIIIESKQKHVCTQLCIRNNYCNSQ